MLLGAIRELTSGITGDDFDAALWSSVEMNVGIVCASLVHFKALFARYWPKLLGLTGRSKRQTDTAGSPIHLPDYHSSIKLDGFDSGQFGSHTAKSIGVLTEVTIETRARALDVEDGGQVNYSGSYMPR